jgi:hypothetical protein
VVNVPPPPDDYPEAIERVLVALLERGPGAGTIALELIADPRRELPKRPSVPRALQAEVFQADRFQPLLRRQGHLDRDHGASRWHLP